jgi:hypothetical protein
MSVCVADVNNDGNQDILIGAPLQSVVNYDEGTVFVYYGAHGRLFSPGTQLLKLVAMIWLKYC